MAKQTDFIKLRGGRTLFHAARVARSLGYEPNLLVTFRFWETSITLAEAGSAFSKIRAKYGKWIQRPPRRFAAHVAPPTFLWVIENPRNKGLHHAHWAVHVPAARHADFRAKLDKWLSSVAEINSPKAIHVEPLTALLGITAYMLKGQFPSIARDHGIRPEPQGWVVGKRSGCSENIGPTQHAVLWKAGKHPRPQRYRQNKYPPRPGATI